MVSSGNTEEIYGERDQQPDAQAIGVVNSDINVAALTKYGLTCNYASIS